MIVIKTVNEILSQYSEAQFIGNLGGRLEYLMPLEINEDLSKRIYSLLNYVYGQDGFHFIPVYINENDEMEISTQNATIFSYIGQRLSLKLVEYANVFKLCNSDISELQGLSYEKDFNKTYAKEKTTGDTYAMSENAPINADLETINTPNMKSQATSNGSKEFEGADNEKETNPYYYEKYLQILSKYNIFEIISNCCKSIIYEYNTLI